MSECDDANPPKFNVERDLHGKFLPGSGGRPKGARNRASRLAQEVFEAESEAVARKAVDLALAGDTIALKIVLDRVNPAPKGRSVEIDVPPVENPHDLITAFAGLLGAAAAGELAPAEAAEIGKLAEGLGKAFELRDLAERVQQLEARLGGAR